MKQGEAKGAPYEGYRGGDHAIAQWRVRVGRMGAQGCTCSTLTSSLVIFFHFSLTLSSPTARGGGGGGTILPTPTVADFLPSLGGGGGVSAISIARPLPRCDAPAGIEKRAGLRPGSDVAIKKPWTGAGSDIITAQASAHDVTLRRAETDTAAARCPPPVSVRGIFWMAPVLRLQTFEAPLQPDPIRHLKLGL